MNYSFSTAGSREAIIGKTDGVRLKAGLLPHSNHRIYSREAKGITTQQPKKGNECLPIPKLYKQPIPDPFPAGLVQGRPTEDS